MMFLFVSKKAGNSFRRHTGQANKGDYRERKTTKTREKRSGKWKRGGRGWGRGGERQVFTLLSFSPPLLSVWKSTE